MRATTQHEHTASEKNTILTLDINTNGVTDFGETYDVSQLKSIISELSNIEVTRLISIPVYGRKSELLDSTKKGTMVIGYLIKFNAESNTAKVAIYPKYADKFDNTSYIKLRIMLDKREKFVRQIIGIDVVAKSEVTDIVED